MAQITEVHNFLNDPTHPNHVILFQVKNDVSAVPHKQELFGQIIIVRPVFHTELKNIFYLLGNTIFLQLHVSMQILERRP